MCEASSGLFSSISLVITRRKHLHLSPLVAPLIFGEQDGHTRYSFLAILDLKIFCLDDSSLIAGWFQIGFVTKKTPHVVYGMGQEV